MAGDLDADAIADRLIRAYDDRTTIPLLSDTIPGFDVAQAYDVLFAIEARRGTEGWTPVGWKIGFTNRALWPRYDVWQPMWARVWDHTLHRTSDGTHVLDLAPFVQPRIETEVVFCLGEPLAPTDDAREVLARTAWIAAGFEIVQCHFPVWRFTAADCTAACGLHGALVVGRPLVLDDATRDDLLVALPEAQVTLCRDTTEVDSGVGSLVLDSPALSLAHLSRVLDAQGVAPLGTGDIVTTGTITDAWPIDADETWTSDYGSLGIEGLTVTCTRS